MNFVKRAGLSLGVRRLRTLTLLGVFTVICSLLLGGLLLRDAAARQQADAQRTIGVDVTIKGKGLTSALVDQLGASKPVHRFNQVVPLQAGELGQGSLTVNGVRDTGMLLPFSFGSAKITSGRGIRPEDAGRQVAVVEQRLATTNGLKVGDTIRVRSADGRTTVPLTIVGVFDDPTQNPARRPPPQELPGNTLYAPVGVVRQLGGGTAAPAEAVFRIGSPDQAGPLHAEAERLLGAGRFDFAVNDKAYRDQVLPIQRVGTFAGLIVWVIAGAGALILALIVLLQVRERRDELGVLLAIGEKKWKLIGQHAVEVAVLVLPAVALAALAGHLLGHRTGAALLPHAVIAPPVLRVEPAAVAEVAALGLGISLAATVVPGIGIARLHPRSILATGE